MYFPPCMDLLLVKLPRIGNGVFPPDYHSFNAYIR